MKKSTGSIDKEIGSRVRMRRISIGMSQEKLGDMLGLTFQQVQKYEKGTNRISVGRLVDIAKILGVDIHFFFDGIKSAKTDAGLRRGRLARLYRGFDVDAGRPSAHAAPSPASRTPRSARASSSSSPRSPLRTEDGAFVIKNAFA